MPVSPIPYTDPGTALEHGSTVVATDRSDDALRLRVTLANIAPGTSLRDGLERVLRGRTGALIVLLLGACVYRQDIPQGNFFKAEDAAQLAAGMTREQVQFVMGTPMIADPVHPDRWDYVYVLQKEGRRVEQRHIVVIFKDDKLQRIEGDVKPAPSAASSSYQAPTESDAERGVGTESWNETRY